MALPVFHLRVSTFFSFSLSVSDPIDTIAIHPAR
jgi:hypothetical protein